MQVVQELVERSVSLLGPRLGLKFLGFGLKVGISEYGLGSAETADFGARNEDSGVFEEVVTVYVVSL